MDDKNGCDRPCEEGSAGNVRVVFVTVPDDETGIRLAQSVVEERLAACGNVVSGLTSVYRWSGKIHQESESLVIFKTTGTVLDQLMKRVVELHPYDVPEFLALPILDGYPPYLDWVKGEVEEPRLT